MLGPKNISQYDKPMAAIAIGYSKRKNWLQRKTKGASDQTLQVSKYVLKFSLFKYLPPSQC